MENLYDDGEDLKKALVSIIESKEQFPVDFDDAWQWIGYSRKDVALSILKRAATVNIDYSVAECKASIQGIAAKKQYRLTIDCFKAFCMMAGTVKGREVRQYYLQIEKEYHRLASPRRIDATFLRDIADELEKKERQIANLSPKAAVWDALCAGKATIDLGAYAKIVNKKAPGIGPVNIFRILREHGILYYKAGYNVPYQEYQDCGYFVVTERPVETDNFDSISLQARITPEGQAWLFRKLREWGYVPDLLMVKP